MIREPTVGMRVEICKPQCKFHGQYGVIFRLDLDGFIWVRFKQEHTWPYYSRHLTEIKENDMTLKEAIESGRRWKRKHWPCWKTLETCISMDTDQAIKADFEIEPMPKVKELTVADIEEKYGCKVKIVK